MEKKLTGKDRTAAKDPVEKAGKQSVELSDNGAEETKSKSSIQFHFMWRCSLPNGGMWPKEWLVWVLLILTVLLLVTFLVGNTNELLRLMQGFF